MAIRTTTAAVKRIVETSLDAGLIDTFIADASLWVDEELATLSPTISSARLETIERWLAAALIRARDVGLVDVAIKDSKENYQVDSEVTEYLLHAASLDSTGTVRRHFLAAKPTQAPVNIIARVGPGFVEEAITE